MGLTLGLVIVALNEAEHIEGCIRSAPGVDEIIVIDNDSNDATATIARANGATVHTMPGTLGAIRQRSVELASSDWLIALDADERLPGGAVEQLRGILATAPPDLACLKLPIRTYIGDRFVRWGGLYPAPRPRVLRRSAVRWDPRQTVHEQPILLGRTRLEAVVIDHFGFRDLAHYRDKQRVYAQWAAQALLAEGRTMGRVDSGIRAGWRWLRVLILRGGFLAGRLGFGIASVQARAVWLRGALSRRAAG